MIQLQDDERFYHRHRRGHGGVGDRHGSRPAVSRHAPAGIGKRGSLAPHQSGQKSVNFRRSASYGLDVLATTMKFWLQRMGIATFRLFSPERKEIGPEYYSDTRVPTAGQLAEYASAECSRPVTVMAKTVRSWRPAAVPLSKPADPGAATAVFLIPRWSSMDVFGNERSQSSTT